MRSSIFLNTDHDLASYNSLILSWVDGSGNSEGYILMGRGIQGMKTTGLEMSIICNFLK